VFRFLPGGVLGAARIVALWTAHEAAGIKLVDYSSAIAPAAPLLIFLLEALRHSLFMKAAVSVHTDHDFAIILLTVVETDARDLQVFALSLAVVAHQAGFIALFINFGVEERTYPFDQILHAVHIVANLARKRGTVEEFGMIVRASTAKHDGIANHFDPYASGTGQV
jgi:hypothetical protein